VGEEEDVDFLLFCWAFNSQINSVYEGLQQQQVFPFPFLFACLLSNPAIIIIIISPQSVCSKKLLQFNQRTTTVRALFITSWRQEETSCALTDKEKITKILEAKKQQQVHHQDN